MADLDTLKAKYQAVIELGKARGVSWKNVHLENDTLLLRGAAPSAAVKDEVWDLIKQIDATGTDVTADLSIDGRLPVLSRIHVVVKGETLSRIARHFYGDSGLYRKIFEANQHQLDDPNKIKPGQKLVIPN
jgi:nucleoid-associated protein YgaU